MKILNVSVSLFVCLLLTGCVDSVRVFTHPPGGHLTVNGIPQGKGVPSQGSLVSVRWWTLDPPRVHVNWNDEEHYDGNMQVGLGEPNHPEYLVADGILALFFIVPGAVAFMFNGVGPLPEQHFYAPSR